MRVIAGKFRGRTLEEVKSEKTRPTMDRIKQSMFDSLSSEVEGARVLDLFAGSGSLGIEALSRGAKSGIFVDIDKNACDVVSRNLAKFGENAKNVFCMPWESALKKFAGDGGSESKVFDLIFLDPPYQSRFGFEAIEKIKELGLLADGGIIIFECGKKAEETARLGFSVKTIKYGDKFVHFLRK